MKLDIKSTTNTALKKMDLPSQFDEEFRPDLIRRAVEAIQSHKRQRYGADSEAGKKQSTKLSRRRRDYRGSYGIGISRVPRKILSKMGSRMNWVGALAPGTVSGRRAHPPKVIKIIAKSINVKERKKAIRCALSAALNKQAVEKRGHKMPKDYPFIVEDKLESIAKTKDIETTLSTLGFSDELERTLEKRLKAGKATMRGRPYKRKKGVLLVVSGECPLQKSAVNIPGVDVVIVDKLNAEHLAPGGDCGRLTVFTEKAIARIQNENLFTNNQKHPQEKPKGAKK